MNKPQTEEKPKMDLAKQVSLFLGGEQAAYQAFEILLKAVLGFGAKAYTYNSVVGARVKGPASFAEKCIRKQDKYTQPVYELTDLCGARVVTNTLDEVDRMCAFVEQCFVVDWNNSEDKLSILKTSEFAYRSVHYVVGVELKRLQELKLPIKLDVKLLEEHGIEPPNLEGLVAKINGPYKDNPNAPERKAEIQVRTIMQHVWADTLHDRTYKSGIQLPKTLLRESHRIAALLDKADEDLLHLNMQIDSYAKDYASHLSPDSLEKELGIVQSLVNQDSLMSEEKDDQVLRLLGLFASARKWDEILENSHLKSTHGSQSFVDAFDRLQALANCRVHADKPSSDEFQSGLKTLERLAAPVVAKDMIGDDLGAELDSISEQLAGSVDGHGQILRDPKRSQIMSEYAWAQYRDRNGKRRRVSAGEAMFQAHLLDPSNPYIYGDLMWLQLEMDPERKFLQYNWAAIEEAMNRCRSHLAVGLDKNRGWATLGRFHLLRSEWSEAGQAYAQLISSVTSREIIDDECMLLDTSAQIKKGSLLRLHVGLLVRTLKVAAALHGKKTPTNDAAVPENATVLAVAGTCAPEKASSIEPFRSAIVDSIRAFKGIVISGATTTGVAGMVESAFKAGCPGGKLIGFAPRRSGMETPPPYTKIVQGDLPDFGIESVVQYWEYLLEKGYIPSQVRVLGAGGGPIGRFEYDLALALGATVGLVRGSGREADRLLGEDPWWDEGHLADLYDPESILLFSVHPSADSDNTDPMTDRVAELAHKAYLDGFGVLPEKYRSWKDLPDKFKTANTDQASAIPLLLRYFGLEVHLLTNPPAGMNRVASLDAVLDAKQIQALARLEHARWGNERGRSGWRYGKIRDDERLIHPNMLSWDKLKPKDRDKDFNAVMAWVASLEACGYGVFRTKPK